MKKIFAMILATLLLVYIVFDLTFARDPNVQASIKQTCADMKAKGEELVKLTPVTMTDQIMETVNQTCEKIGAEELAKKKTVDLPGNMQYDMKSGEVFLKPSGWNVFRKNTLNFFANFLKLLLGYSNLYLEGLRNTIMISILALIIGTVLGALMALMRISSIKPLRGFASTYIEIFRGTPLMVQLLFIYYGTSLNQIFPNLDVPWLADFPRMMTCVVVMSLNSCAYVAEVIRSGIQAVDIGQTEAARSLGFSSGQTMRKVVLPQAIKNILPALGNEFVTVIKESSIVIYVGVADLMFRAKGVTSKTYITLESYLIAALVYLVLTFCLSTVVDIFERRMKRGRN